ICAVIAAAFAENRTPPTIFEISAHLLLPAHLTESLCAHLLAAGLIREVYSGRRVLGFVPARPLADLSAADVVRVLRHDVGVAHWGISGDSKDLIDTLLLGAEKDLMTRLSEVRWTDLAQNAHRPRNVG